MKSTSDYSTYQLHELEDALKKVDKTTNPEEAKIIRELISKGGYAYPTEPEIERVRFTNTAYKWVLVVVLSVLFSLNLIIFASTHNVFSIVPIALQGLILLMIYKNHKQTRMLIKVWCGLLIVSSLLGLMSIYFAPEIDNAILMNHVLTLIVGLVFFLLSDKYVQLIPVTLTSLSGSTKHAA